MSEPVEPARPGEPVEELRTPTTEERNWALAAHLGGLAGFLGAGLGAVLVPLVIWLVKREDSAFIDDQAKEALNFQITIFVASILAGLLMLVIIGFVLLPIIIVADIVLCVMAATAANRGERFRYPDILCWRFIS